MRLSSRTLLFCAELLAKTGFSGIRLAGNGLGTLLWHTLGSRRRLAIDNITKHIACSSDTATTLARNSFKHNARSFLECVLAPDFGLQHPLLRVERPDLLARIATEERPAVIVAAHLGAWELLASLLGDISSTRPRLTVVRTYKNKALNDVSTLLRSSRGAQVLGHREAAFSVLRALKKNGYAAFLVDHNTGHDEAVFLPFLGEEAAVNKGPALLAVRAKAQVWPIFLLRDGKRFVLRMEDPLDTTHLTGDAEGKIHETTRFITAAIERAVRFAPEQWFWMHNRWKTKK
ncbi:MAG: lysophospholipid acyltransferase family protein [Bilophila sp.]